MNKDLQIRLARCHQKIKDHMQWDDEKVNLWFNTKNPFFGNIEPIKFMALRPEKAEILIDDLIEGNIA